VVPAEFGSCRPVGPGCGYWLWRCEGVCIDSPNRRVGFVDELRYGSSLKAPDTVAVRAGLFGEAPLRRSHATPSSGIERAWR
jgi:hypothetical protein